MRADIAKLANQMNRMTMQQTQQMQPVQQMSICCELYGNCHMSDMCPTNPKSIYYVGQQSRGPINQHAQYGNTYNPNWNNHPNFSRGGNQPNQNHYRPQGNFNQPQKPPNKWKRLRTDFRNLERQMGRLAANQNTRPAGALPGDTEKNPQVNAVTLRNGRELEEIQLNIPLVDLLREIPKYAKYIKDIVAQKRRLTEFETVALTEECTSRVQNKLPQKLKDPSSFTIPVQIGMGAPRPTIVMLQLADRSIAHPEGVIEDVLLQIGKFIISVDFIILDYEANELQLLDTSVYLDGSLEKALMLSDSLENDDEVEEMMHILDASCAYMQRIHPFEPLNRPSRPPPKLSIEKAP
ncbi:PREDICTED: uncharacterized protein LOC109215036 [Nicotiana attenuata]|uniref:uncharacterized protein LOC109215036 n=1 Tax=Nicotiana attenuata TaxID=49451 RepID=UPI00090511F1|nr:PREDICTED: uncharacterized protein LOC109215036 [Nicotiana attenuata]